MVFQFAFMQHEFKLAMCTREIFIYLFIFFRKQFHLLNLSSNEVLQIIRDAKSKGAQISAETCPHYLSLAAEEIEDCHTEYKTQPPIRSKTNQSALWKAFKTDCLDIIASDHSPATPGPKCLTYGKMRGNFLSAWPGISSLQLGK